MDRIGYMIQNQIKEDSTLIFDHNAILQSYQGIIVFSSLVMSDRSELFNKFIMDSQMFLPYLPFKILSSNALLYIKMKTSSDLQYPTFRRYH